MEEYCNTWCRSLNKKYLLNYLIYYLPHHGVLRKDSLATKLRAVFNSSALTTDGLTQRYNGPNLSPNIVDVLTWSWIQPFLFSTDITKIYRHINFHLRNWNLQRILWVDDTGQLTHFHLTTVTYGTQAAPYLAIRILLQLVNDDEDNYPLAVDSLLYGLRWSIIQGNPHRKGQSVNLTLHGGRNLH